jgi:hypothetical protein
VKGNISLDARSPTEYGTVRSYIDVGVSTSQNGNGDSVGTGAIAQNGTGNLFINQSSDDFANYANRWFIQWAGFTAGRSTSFFDFYSIGANQYGYVGASSDTGDGGWLVFANTAQFGNGLSASLSAEEQRRTQILSTTNTTVASSTTLQFEPGDVFLTAAPALGAGYRGHDYPDVVANLRVDQAWGSAQVMGALHNVSASYYSAAAGEASGYPSDKMGFALGAGVKFNAPMIGPGDYFQIEGDYTEGASRYANHTAGLWNYVIYSGQEIGFGFNTDAVFGATSGAHTDLELTTAWAVNAAYTHNWNAAWKSTLWGSYFAENYNTAANNILCTGRATTSLTGCDMNWSIWGAGLRTQWAVSNTFQIGLEVVYSHLNSADASSGFVFQPQGNSSKAAGDYRAADQNIWAARFRVNRDFYP